MYGTPKRSAICGLDFAVPDMPAFKVLHNEPSNLLRPSTPQAIAVSLFEFYQDCRLRLPSDFRMEILPSLLLTSHKRLSEVQARYSRGAYRVLNSFRISVGTGRAVSYPHSRRSQTFTQLGRCGLKLSAVYLLANPLYTCLTPFANQSCF